MSDQAPARWVLWGTATVVLVVLILALAGCGTFRPGQGVSEDFARSWGCDPAFVERRSEELRAELPQGQVYVPQVGWSACALLAHNGRPSDYDLHQTERGRSASWWYQSSSATHLVRLEQQGREWRVTYVGW